MYRRDLFSNDISESCKSWIAVNLQSILLDDESNLNMTINEFIHKANKTLNKIATDSKKEFGLGYTKFDNLVEELGKIVEFIDIK